MKNSVIALALIITGMANICYSQERKDIELTISGGLADMGGITGYSIQNDLSAPFHRFFGLSMSLTYATADDGLKNNMVATPTSGSMHHQTLLSAQFSIYFTPYHTMNHCAYLGGGAGVNHHVSSQSSGSGSVYNLDNHIDTGIGPNLAFGYDYTFEEGIVVGIKGMGIYSTDWINMILLRLGYRL